VFWKLRYLVLRIVAKIFVVILYKIYYLDNIQMWYFAYWVLNMGDRGSTVVKVLCYKSDCRWFDPSWCHWIFFINIKSFRSHYGPGVDLASNRNKYQDHFLGGKGGRCVRLTTLLPSCAVVTKSESLNFLEPSGPVQACNGTALPLSVLNIMIEKTCWLPYTPPLH